MIDIWKNKRVTVMGLGRFGGGVGAVRWLVNQGARVTVTDTASEDTLRDSLAQIDDCEVVLRLGGHQDSDFDGVDAVAVSPAVPQNSPYLDLARRSGALITSEMNLFAQRCPARCVGITGSVGKSTVTAMIGHILSQTLPAPRRVWVGGNIGRSLLEDLPDISASDIVVLELSSFQLEVLPAIHWSPNIALITNVAPNHLDRHGTFAAYLAAKLNIVRFQDPARDAIIIHGDPELQGHFDLLFGDLAGIWRYGLQGDVPTARMQSTSAVESVDKHLSWPTLNLTVPGSHNRTNAAAALTVANLLDVPADDAIAALRSFKALPHRLQHVGEIDGVAYYNDSKSTTPEAALTAMRAIERPLLVILGGYDKGVDLSELACSAAPLIRYAACIGQTGESLARQIRAADRQTDYYESLAAAVAACRGRARTGDAILLSPACASFGQFRDYRARGDAFVQLVGTTP